MRLRRVRTRSGLDTQQYAGGRWIPLNAETPFGPSPFSDAWQVATADRHLQHTDSLLPFAPLSFRDFLLSEEHHVNASRGMLKRFYPGTFRLTRAVERATRRTFPAFKPKQLFYEEPIYSIRSLTRSTSASSSVSTSNSTFQIRATIEKSWPVVISADLR